MKRPVIEIIVRTKKRIPRKDVLAACHRLFKILYKRQVLKKKRARGPFSDLTLVFLDKPAARKLNKKYREKNYPTDILSFETDLSNQGLGDLVFCTPVLVRQAKEHGISFKEEIVYLVIHGVLHLLGYEHERSRKEAERMLKLQDRLFEQLR